MRVAGVRRTSLPALVLALCLTVPAGCGGGVDITPPEPSTGTAAQQAEQAQQALAGLVDALASGTREDAEELAAPGAGDLLGSVHDNAAALRIGGLAMRYVDEGPALDAEERARLGQDAWRANVQLEYLYEGLDATPARMETSVVLLPDPDPDADPADGAARIVSFGGPGERSPLWLVDRLAVVRTATSLVAVAGGAVGRYSGLVTTAIRQVRRTLPAWDARLLVEVPESTGQLEAAVMSEPGQYDNIAAVTTTADGSLAPGAPVRVFVNPAVFGKLKQRGAQVVMSHEATHVATEATFASMPTWLLEGFADFVALDGAGVPVEVAAGQILARIRKDGLPRRLPTSTDLDPTASGLGATYEEAWLACRFLAEEYGTGRMVSFYRTVSDGASVEEAFRSELGTSQPRFVAQWRADLARLAGVAG